MEEDADGFMLFLQENPDYFSIMKSKIFIAVLAFIEEKPRILSEVYGQYSKVERSDLDEVLQTLKDLKLIEDIKSTDNLLHKITKEGEDLLARFRKFRKSIDAI